MLVYIDTFEQATTADFPERSNSFSAHLNF